MAIAVQQIYPVAHLPLILGVFRRLEVATLIDQLIPPHPAHGLSCGRGVEALVLRDSGRAACPLQGRQTARRARNGAAAAAGAHAGWAQ